MSEKENDNKNPDANQLDDEALERLAVEELMREAVQGAARAEVVGPSGWVRNSSQPKANKRFLTNTIRHAVASNRLHSSRNKTSHRSTKSPKRERRNSESLRERFKQKH